MELIQLELLQPAPFNPRKIEKVQLERLKKSLVKDKEFLNARPLIVNKNNMHVVGGNQRLSAAKELGWKEIPCELFDIDEKTEKRWNLMDNSNYGTWEQKLLGELLSVMSPQEIDETGLDQETIDKALAKAMADLNGQDVDSVPETPVTPTSCLGDVYQLGGSVLCPHCGENNALGIVDGR